MQIQTEGKADDFRLWLSFYMCSVLSLDLRNKLRDNGLYISIGWGWIVDWLEWEREWETCILLTLLNHCHISIWIHFFSILPNKNYQKRLTDIWLTNSRHDSSRSSPIGELTCHLNWFHQQNSSGYSPIGELTCHLNELYWRNSWWVSPIGELRHEIRQWRKYRWRNYQLAKLQRLSLDHSSSRWMEELFQLERWISRGIDGDREDLCPSSTTSFSLLNRTTDISQCDETGWSTARLWQPIRSKMVRSRSKPLVSQLSSTPEGRMFASSSIHWSIVGIEINERGPDEVGKSNFFSILFDTFGIFSPEKMKTSASVNDGGLYQRTTKMWNWLMYRQSMGEWWRMGLPRCIWWIQAIEFHHFQSTSRSNSS